MKHATRLSDFGLEVVERVLAVAKAWKHKPHPNHLREKLLGMVFFNPSLRTRASFEAVMARGGGGSIVLEAGSGSWKLEDRLGVRMDGNCAEHLKEAVPVLGRYVNALAVRAFAAGLDDDEENADAIVRGFREYSTVPTVSMESVREHPCQGLADLLTMEEQFGCARGLPVTLTWVPHIKSLPRAVPNSLLLTAAARGCEIRIAHPPGFELDRDVLREAEAYAAASCGSISSFTDQGAALAGARVVYAKSWGSANSGVNGTAAARHHARWMISPEQMKSAARDAVFLHCLPVRRNVEVSDSVLDGRWSRVVDQAENRFHVQRALLDWLFT